MADGSKTQDISGDEPEVVTLRRVGKPPLRLKARRIDQVVGRSSAGMPLELALWERPRGGVALQYSRLRPGGPMPDAAVFSDRSAAICEIERLCVQVGRSRQSKLRKRASAVEAMSRLESNSTMIDDARTFLVLAGEALYRWDRAAPRNELSSGD